MKNSYTEKQIEMENLLRSVIGDAKIIDEIVALAGESEQKTTDIDKSQENIESIIKMRLLETTDWRKKAALSALLISNNLK